MLKRKKPLVRRSSLKRTGLRQAAAGTNAGKTSPAADAAHKLWSILRDRDVAGLRFRHHERVGPYVVDFLCPAARVIILVEGTTPIDPTQTQWFHDHGYRVLQFPEADVRGNPQIVLDAVAREFEIKIIPKT